MRVIVALLLVLLAVAPAAGQSRFTTRGPDIIGPDGKPVVMRGLGLGGWLMPEGYMLRMPGYGSPTSMREQIDEVGGPGTADAFFARFTELYVTRDDVRLIAEWGFDHVRLPFHYALLMEPETWSFREEGFALVDRFIEWCREAGLYVILDLHAAPGGQNHLNIADAHGEAMLWTRPDVYQPPTVALWAEIARRYADEPVIVGYDLINEPVLPDDVTDSALLDLYRRLAAAVRQHDSGHVLFIEGDWFATDFSAIVPPFDDVMVYAFHKYWNATDRETIEYILDIRRRYDVPIWLGESGENSNVWFFEVTRMLEGLDVGWNWWTHKKFDTVTAPLSAPLVDGYRDLRAWWQDRGPKPDPETARAALMAQVEMLALERCERRPDVLAALLSPDFGSETRPYRPHTLPGTLPAAEYDIGLPGAAYADVENKNESGSPSIANEGGAFRNDGVDIGDGPGGGHHVGWIEAGEWLQYTVDVAATDSYDVALRVAAAESGGVVRLDVDGATVGRWGIPRTGGPDAWTSVRPGAVRLPAGRHALRLVFEKSGFRIASITLGDDALGRLDTPRHGMYPLPPSGRARESPARRSPRP